MCQVVPIVCGYIIKVDCVQEAKALYKGYLTYKLFFSLRQSGLVEILLKYY